MDHAPGSLPLAYLGDFFRRDGFAVLAVLRDWTKQRPLVFLTGFKDYIGYPFIAAEIAVRLECVAPLPSFGGTPAPMDVADRAMTSKSAPPASPTAQEIALVDATCRFMQIDISVHHELDALAFRMGSNRNSLARAFRHVLGVGVYSWLRQSRMVAAARLLKTTDRSIQEISFDVGYEDPGNFSTSFRQHYGLSPRAFRKTMRISKV